MSEPTAVDALNTVLYQLPYPATEGDARIIIEALASAGWGLFREAEAARSPSVERPAEWSSRWRDDVTGAGLTRDEAIEWASVAIRRMGDVRRWAEDHGNADLLAFLAEYAALGPDPAHVEPGGEPRTVSLDPTKPEEWRAGGGV